MHRIINAFLLITMVFIASCDINKQEDAMKYSNEIAATNDTLAYHGSLWAEELKVAINTLDFSQLEKYKVNMLTYIDEKIIEVGNMQNIGGSEHLQKAELEFLRFEKRIVNQYFTAFEQMDSTTSVQAIQAAYMSVMEQGEEEQKKQQAMQKLREEYADNNGFPKPIE